MTVLRETAQEKLLPVPILPTSQKQSRWDNLSADRIPPNIKDLPALDPKMQRQTRPCLGSVGLHDTARPGPDAAVSGFFWNGGALPAWGR